MEIIKYNEIHNRKKNLISLVLFRVLDEYREFEKYLYHFNLLIRYLVKNDYDFDIRVYFDDSSQKDIEPFIKEFSEIEFYKFNYKPLRIGKYHHGTFGSIIRLLPIFEELYEYIYIDDVDIPVEWVNWEVVEFIFKNKVDTYLYSLAYNKHPWFNSSNKYNTVYPIITRLKFSINIFNKFLNDIVNNNYEDLIKKFINYRTYQHYYNYNVKFPYGMDKYFLNNIIYNDLCSGLTYTKISYDPTRILRYVYEHKFNLFTKRDIDIITNLINLDKISFKSDINDIKIYTKIIYLKLLDKIGKDYILKFLDDAQKKVFLEFYNFLDRNKDKIEDKTMNTFSEMIKIS